MRAVRHSGGRVVVAYSGKHSVALSMGWPEAEHDGLLGFAIRRTGPDSRVEWLPTALQYEGADIVAGRLHTSNDAPVQSFVWCDFGLDQDYTAVGLPAATRFGYEVIPVRGTPQHPVLADDEAVRIAISTEPEREHGPDKPEVHFNRGLSASQEYARLFGEDHEPETDPAALAWLARDLDTVITDFISEAIDDPTLLLDVAAYHLDKPEVIEAICKVGARARVSLDWGVEEGESLDGPNGPAYRQLTAAGVTVHQRRHVAISHNKYIVLKEASGAGRAVLTGSTNFTVGGISSQSNQSVIVRNPALAEAFVADFQRVLHDDNIDLRSADISGTVVDDTLSVHFSPHAAADRPDLDELVSLARAATSSRLFMTFRMTDPVLVDAMLEPSVPAFGVADRVYEGNDGSGDRLLYAEAHTPDPRVVACNAPLSDEPDEHALIRELKRGGYDPLVHHKILLLDFDTPDCVVVTGSANYSTNSSAHNDENSLIVHGDQRLAEEYFIEFCRLYTHWRPRWLRERNLHGPAGIEHLAADSTWTSAWGAGSRAGQFLRMALGDDASGPSAEQLQRANAPGIRPSLAGQRINHVVVMMLENRSFDQMLGQLEGVDGVRLGPDGADRTHINYLDPRNPREDDAFPVTAATFFGIPEGDIPPPTISDNTVSNLYGGPAHSFPAASQQIYNDSWGPGGSDAQATTPERSSGFARAYAESLVRTYQDWAKLDPEFSPPAQPAREHVAVAMASFSPEQLPVINGLAAEFCVCDRWFSEVPGPTEPNRLFTHAATSQGFVHNPWSVPITARTLYEDLDETPDRTWAFYFYDLSDADNFPQLKKRIDRTRPFSQFTTDLASPDTFPSYSFLCPRYVDSPDGFANSQHAPYDVRYGEAWIADVYEALRNSPIWDSTLLVVTYDEHGGFYDHVYPPDTNVLPPDTLSSPTDYDRAHSGYMFQGSGRPKPQYVFDFDRLGCRVPTVLISPWLDAGQVCSTQLQHTSLIATVRKMWGLRPQPLTAREAQAATFDALLEQRDSPRDDCPTKLDRPPLPPRSLSAALDQPLSPAQREVFAQVEHLDGHRDSGAPPPLPRTQGEMSAYVAERRAAHVAYHTGSAVGAAPTKGASSNA